MKKFLLTTAVSIALMVSAFAADLPIKAPQQVFGPYPVNGCGLYYGINSMGSANAIAGGPVGGQIVQGDIGLTLGYTCALSPNGSFWFVEGNFDWANLNGSQNGFSMTGPLHLQQRAAFGSPLNSLLSQIFPVTNSLAVPPLPVLPNGITAGPGAAYAFVALDEQDISASFGLKSNRDWMISPGFGIGMLYRLSNNVVADVSVMYKMQTNAVCLGGAGSTCPALGQGVQAGLAFKW
jgi:opacity protein-like surface antigen